MSAIQTVKTGVCGDLQLHKVTDPGWALTLRQVLRDLTCDDSVSTRFPGPNPVSLDSSHFKRLRSEPYFVCEKTDGVRFMLVCARAHGLNVVAIMDRTLTPYLLPLRHVPKALYQGTSLDGELAWNKVTRAWDFVVFDAVCVSGIPVLNTPLKDRLEAVHRALDKYQPHPRDPVTLKLKSFVACGALSGVDAHLEGAARQYDVDGVILTPAMAPVVYGRHMGMFKLKFGDKHTVDFLVADDRRRLCVFDSGRHVAVGVLTEEATPGAIAECSLAERRDGDQQHVWSLVSVRTDKGTANDMFTYQKTLLNMRENLTLESIKGLFAA